MAIEIGKIRNVGVVGHGGVGKTSLVEAMLFAAGAVTRVQVQSTLNNSIVAACVVKAANTWKFPA